MAAPKGNQYWRIRSKDGRDKQYKTPQEFADACNEYFQWIDDNPFGEEQLFAFQGHITKDHASKMRPYTLEGLCNFLDLSLVGFRLYEEREDFVSVTTRVRQIIYNQKFEGAAAGFLNPNIIARDLGLAERTQNENIIKVKGVTDDELNDLLNE